MANQETSNPVPEHQPLFPTMGSTQEVIDMAQSQIPIKDKNALITVLGTYHNTLLAQVSKNTKSK